MTTQEKSTIQKSTLQQLDLTSVLARFPAQLFEALQQSAAELDLQIYLVGGVLRDALTGVLTNDLDLAIPAGAERFLRRVRHQFGGGALVVLGDQQDDTCRLVIDGLVVDVAGFRGGAMSIEEDLARRDFTINSMAVGLVDFLRAGPADLLDPLGGAADLEAGLIRACPEAFANDPLRLLRAYRFAAQLDFAIEPATQLEIAAHAPLINQCAGERLSYELDLILESSRASANFEAMRATGLLRHLIPELYEGSGVAQPPFHHLDVMEHNLKTLDWVEQVSMDQKSFFPGSAETVAWFPGRQGERVELKWAALLHDIGKPSTRKINREKQDRITFYNHDEQGVEIARAIGGRLRWSKLRSRRICSLIAMHMHPFHLANVLRKEGEVSRRAMLKLCKRAGDQLAPLFMLAMADSLAGQGADKPDGIEALLQTLFEQLMTFYEDIMQPVVSGPKLLTGYDLIDTLGLQSGPEIGRLLEAVEMAAVAGEIDSKEEALVWLRKRLPGG